MVDQIFVGRDAEMNILQESLESVYRDQACRICLVTGDAGSGKTTLIENFSQFAEERYAETVIVAAGKCNAQTGSIDTYLPFREIINQLTGIQAKILKSSMDNRPAGWLRNFTDGALEALIEFGPDLIGTFIPGSTLVARLAQTTINSALRKRAESRVGGQEVNKKEVSKQYSDVISKIANSTRTIILIVDDLQWADEASLQLFAHLAETLKDQPVMLIGTYRSKEVEEAGEDHPLYKYILSRQWGFWETRIDLRESNRKNGKEFVRLFLAANKCRTDEDFEKEFFERTEGNALFVVELFRYLYDHKLLSPDETGDIVADNSMDWSKLPAQLRKLEGLIEARFESLSAELREILDIASIEGQDFTAQVILNLLKLSSLSEYDLLRTLFADLEKKHNLVSQVRELPVGPEVLSQYRFVNATFHQYLYNDMSLGQRRLRHREVAATLEKLYGSHSAEIANQLAWHYELSYMPEKVVRYLNLAGEQLARVSEYSEAEVTFNKALSLARIQNDKIGLVDSMRYICGSIWMVQDKNDEAKEQLLEALELTRNIKYRNGEIYILRQLGILARRRRHYTTATKYYLESLEIARRAEADAENEDERVNAKNSMAQALNNLGTAAMAERAYDDAAEYFKERLKIAIELNNQEGKLFAYLNIGDLDWRRGRDVSKVNQEDAARGYWALAKVSLEQALEIGNSIGAKSQVATAEKNLGDLAISEMDYAEAAIHIARSLGIIIGSGITSKILGNLASVSSLLAGIDKPEDAILYAHFVSIHPKSTEFEKEIADEAMHITRRNNPSIDTVVIFSRARASERDTLARSALDLLQSLEG